MSQRENFEINDYTFYLLATESELRINIIITQKMTDISIAIGCKVLNVRYNKWSEILDSFVKFHFFMGMSFRGNIDLDLNK